MSIERFIGSHQADIVAEQAEAAIKNVLGIEVECYITPDRTQQEGAVINIHRATGDIHCGEPICQFKLTQMPGCCAYLVSHDAYVEPNYRSKGVAQATQDVKTEISRYAGYTKMICTTTSHNKTQNHVLEKHGWIKTDSVLNERTGNLVITWTKKVL